LDGCIQVNTVKKDKHLKRVAKLEASQFRYDINADNRRAVGVKFYQGQAYFGRVARPNTDRLDEIK
jgi:hypothetical protein